MVAMLRRGQVVVVTDAKGNKRSVRQQLLLKQTYTVGILLKRKTGNGGIYAVTINGRTIAETFLTPTEIVLFAGETEVAVLDLQIKLK